jgi:hypothetical protein
VNETTPTGTARATTATAPASPAPATRLIPLKDWPKAYPWPTERALRHLVFNAATNGFDRVVRRVGRRVLIDESAFFRWVEEQNP